MARGRMLDRAFTKSKKINALHRDHRLAYAMILPYLDKEGRINAENIVLKANVFRWSDYTLDEIAAAVKAIAEVGLARLYADDDNAAILEFTNFLEHNSPNKKEAASEFPSPDSDGVRAVPMQSTGNARAMPVENVNVNVNVNDNENETLVTPEITVSRPALAATPPRASHDPGMFIEAWNANRGRLPAVTALNSKRRSAIRALVKEHGPDPALELLRDAARAVATDDFWLTRQYGFDNLLTGGKVLARAEQWRAGGTQLSAGNAKLATTAMSVANAIGGLNDRPN